MRKSCEEHDQCQDTFRTMCDHSSKKVHQDFNQSEELRSETPQTNSDEGNKDLGLANQKWSPRGDCKKVIIVNFKWLSIWIRNSMKLNDKITLFFYFFILSHSGSFFRSQGPRGDWPIWYKTHGWINFKVCKHCQISLRIRCINQTIKIFCMMSWCDRNKGTFVVQFKKKEIYLFATVLE